MAQLSILFPSAYRRDVHDSARRPSYRIDSQRSGDDWQGFWFRPMAGASARVEQGLRLGGSSALAR